MKKRYGTFGCLVLGLVLFWACQAMAGEKVPPPSRQILGEYKNGEAIFILPGQLNERRGNPNLVILDADHPRVYRKGHIPGAINIGFMGLCNVKGKPGDSKWGTVLDKEFLVEKLRSLGVTNKSFIVVYSDIFKGPGAGGRALWQLKMAGFENSRLLYGGFAAWKKAGFEVTRQKTIVLSAVSKLTLPDYNKSYNADMNFVSSNLDRVKIIDVRSKKEFTGRDTSRGEKRGGHIKGAVWMEWTDFLNKDATPKPAAQIIAMMANLGIGLKDNFVLC
ncbi:MAG: sulfurtransferase [Desulfobacteraceae bacterium]|nr:sulfurtransferase [Desulfobacteraceae bacterium]